MAIWTVPSATTAALNGIVAADGVQDGEIVYNVESHSILVGVLVDPNDPTTGSYQTVVGDGQVTNALIANNTIELVKMADVPAHTVLANATSGAAAPTAVSLNINDVLTSDGTTLSSGKITDAHIQTAGLALTSLAEVPSNTVIANGTNASARPTAVAVGSNRLVGRSGSGTVGPVQVTTEHVEDQAITYGKIQNVPTNTIMGRTADNPGSVTSLTPQEAREVLGLSAAPTEATTGLTYDPATGNIAHADTSMVADIPEVVSNDNIAVLTGATFDTYGHVLTADTHVLNDGDNVVFDNADNVLTISVPRATTSLRGAAQFNPNHFDVDTDAVVQLDTSEVGSLLDDHSIPLSKLPTLAEDTLLGNMGSANDAEALSVANVLNMLNLNPGNGLSIDTATNTINVNNLAFANNYVFTTVASRNTGQINGVDITWHPGDIAITTSPMTEVWLYINNASKTGAVLDSDFAEATMDPTNLTITNRSGNGFTIDSSTGSDAAVPAATTALAGLLEATDKVKLDSVEANANNYSFNITAQGTSGTGVIADNETLAFTHSGAATVTRNGDQININAINTTYGASGAGLALNGTVFSHADTSTQASVDNSGRTVIQDITLDGFGHITGISSATLSDTNTTYTGGTGLTLSGTTFNVDDIYLRNNADDTTTGTITAANFCLASDERLKENIETICCGLDKVKAMRGVSYTKDGEAQVGVIAQEVEKVVPEVVVEGEDGYKAVAYSQLVGVLIEAVKDLSAQVEELKNDSSNQRTVMSR